MARIRVLNVCGGLQQGGVESMLVNIFDAIDKEKIQMCFLLYDNSPSFYRKHVEEKGGLVYGMSKPGLNFIGYFRELRKIISSFGPFDVIHIHTDLSSAFPLIAACMHGIPIRVCHSHTTKSVTETSKARKIYRIVSQKIINICANRFLACSTEAGNALFGISKFAKCGIIFPNAIDVKLYSDESDLVVERRRSIYGLSSDCLVLGSVASFGKVKNHGFMLEICLALKGSGIPFKMFFVGDGAERSMIETHVRTLGLNDNVVFTGIRHDVPQLMHMFDVLLMPSLYEGLPVTLVESQAAGLPAVVSSRISKEIDFGLGLISFVSLEAPISDWVSQILDSAKKNNVPWTVRYEALKESNFDTSSSINLLYDLYGVGK